MRPPHSTLLLLAMLTVACYLATAQAQYVYEDDTWLPIVQQPLSWTVPGRSLSLWTLRLTMSQDGPHLAHGVNLAVHLLNGVLVYQIALVLASPVIAVVAAALVWLHPLHSEAVAYLAARSDLLATCGILATVLAALHGRWLLMLLAALMAAASKEIGVLALPLALWSLIASRQVPVSLRDGRLLVLAIPVATLALGSTVWGWLTMPAVSGGSHWSLAWFVWLQLRATGRELALLLIPMGFTLQHDPIALSNGWAVGFLLSLFLVPLLTLRCRTGLPPLVSWSLGWLCLTLGPRVLVRSPEYLNEHQLYLTTCGLMVGLAACLVRLWSDVPQVECLALERTL